MDDATQTAKMPQKSKRTKRATAATTKKADLRSARLTPLTANQLRRVATEFLEPAIRAIEEITEKMDSKSIGSITVDHFGMATRGLESLDRLIESARFECGLAEKGSARDRLLNG
jgi:hypothetical protein